ncbi:MAG: HAMP domain-containing histidine kinase [Bacteroidetes bacterium]|nr:HAMP domain-containing histidine kinase [Bacteroidota bacterium]
MISKITKRNKLFIFLVASFLLILFLSGLLSPLLLNNERKNWDKTLIDKIDFVENAFLKIFDARSNRLSKIDSQLKNALHSKFQKNGFDLKAVFDLFSSSKFSDYSIQLYDSTGNLYAWNSEIIFYGREIPKLADNLNQTFFSGHKLITFLTIADTLRLGKIQFTIVTSTPVYKHYTLSEENNAIVNVADSLSDALGVDVTIDYSPLAQPSKDGRKYSFSILNNYQNKIAVASFDKPSLEAQLNDDKNNVFIFQGILAILILLVIGVWSYPALKKNPTKTVRLIIIVVYLAILRISLFMFGLPAALVHNSLTDASNFSSVFAYGMVRSPLEFTITVAFLLIGLLIAYKYVLAYLEEQNTVRKTKPSFFFLVFLIVIPLYLLSLRGLGAAMRSVVFDSTIRYFKVFSLIPTAPIFLMDINILMLAFCVILFLVMLLVFLFSKRMFEEKEKNLRIFFTTFFIVQFFAWLFDELQSEPQGTPLIRILAIIITFSFAYFVVYSGKRRFIILVYYAFAASLISVSLLSYYNYEIERESLKTTAHELTRTNENVVEFMVLQTMTQIQQNDEIMNAFDQKEDLSPDAFVLWTNSLFYRESVRSAIEFYNSEKKYVGGFQTNKEFYAEPFENYLDGIADSTKIFKQANLYGDEITLVGVSPLKEGNNLIGYMVVSAIYDEDYFNFSYLPDFLIAQRSGISSALDLSKLRVFDFHDNELVRSFGDVSLSDEDQKIILNADFSSHNEAWLNMTMNGEENLVYALKISSPGRNKVLAIALELKKYSWNLSNFFKIFFIHTLIIAIILFIFLTSKLRQLSGVLRSFRTRLIGAFLVVSIIPLIVIAFYFRNLTEEKNSELIQRRLNELTGQVETYIHTYTNETSLNPVTIFDKASHDLGINFSVYENGSLIYSPQNDFVNTGLFPITLSSDVYRNCVVGKYQKIFEQENFDGTGYNSIYSKEEINGANYIISVNDLMNVVSYPFSDVDLDFFLFGIFSLAVILLILFSTLLAEQISLPVRKLTAATKSISNGDLNVEISYQTKGEISDLVDGFNQMVNRIKQSQADIAQFEREAAWKEMAKQVAHEIKNPLTPMKLSIQQLIAAYKDKSPKFDSIFEKVTETVAAQIEILKNIASEFSNFARMPRLNIEKVNIVASINEVLNLFAHENKSINFLTSENVVYVNADQDQLKRTFVNMIRNSIQANAQKIAVTLTKEDDICKIGIEDDGAGIDKENIEKVFDDSFTTKVGGMGLGLSLTKRFIESIGGTIQIEKSSNEGTAFLLTFPLVE